MIKINKVVNPFVYQRILEEDMPNSTIPGWLGESYAQCYEDVIIDGLLRGHIRKVNKGLKSVTFIELGANHPVCTSSSLLWQKRYGITGVLVEANPKLIPALRQFRPNDVVINAAVTNKDIQEIEFFISPENEISSLSEKFVNAWKNLGVEEKIMVPTVRVNDILEVVKNSEVVILIVDVEGLDLDIIKDINFLKFRPFIIQAEPSDGFTPGTSNEMIDFLKTKNYSVIAETDVNLIFVENTRL
jgi:FkbM family methyltransferase